MRVVIQRVHSADVSVDGDVVGEIGPGLLVLVGVAQDDTGTDADRIADKVVALRAFPDEDRPFHRSVAEVGGSVLVVSQFTLLGDLRRGNRPSWAQAARSESAEPLVAAVADRIEAAGIPVARGRFGAEMTVRLENDGPVTLVLDTVEFARPRNG